MSDSNDPISFRPTPKNEVRIECMLRLLSGKIDLDRTGVINTALDEFFERIARDERVPFRVDGLRDTLLEAQQKIEAEERRKKTHAEAEVDRELRVHSWNRAFKDLFGVRASRLRNRDLISLLVKAGAGDVAANLIQGAKGGSGPVKTRAWLTVPASEVSIELEPTEAGYKVTIVPAT